MKVSVTWRGNNKFLVAHEADGGPVSVALAEIKSDDSVTDLLLAKTGDTSQTVDVPSTVKRLQLRFRVNLKIAGVSRESLFVVQAFEVDADRLVPKSYLRFHYRYTVWSSGTDRQFPLQNTQPVAGQHPLLATQRSAGGWQVAVDTEFLDATELWWQVHYRTDEKEFFPWILDPRLTKRIGQLRVLLWTSGDPMIWFVCVSDAAAAGNDPIQPVVFYRPPGSYPYAYTMDEPGFALGRHRAGVYRYDPKEKKQVLVAASGMYVLARYVSNPLPPGASWPRPYQEWSVGFEWPRGGPGADPAVNIDQARLIGLEDATNNPGRPLVLLLPWRNMATLGPGAIGPNLLDRVHSALKTLWNANILGRDRPLPSQFSPALWLAGYSLGGLALWQSAKTNISTLGRVIAIDANELPSTGRQVLLEAAKSKGRGLSLRLIGTPKQQVITEDFIAVFRSAGVDAIGLPDPKKKDFWNPPENEVIRTFAAQWTQGEIKQSWETNHDKWLDLFHQFAAFGGETLISLPKGGRRVQTFFEQSLL